MYKNFFDLSEKNNNVMSHQVKRDALIVECQLNDNEAPISPLFSFENCPVKVSFTDCPVEERKRFYNSNCIMPISVGLGLKVHEGTKFLGILKLINASFRSFTILLDDSIQRYTMRILSDLSDTELYKKAIREGDLWLQRNKHIIDLATIPYKIVRWDDWVNHPRYLEHKKIVEALHQSDDSYRQAFNDTIEEFLMRFRKNIEVGSGKKFDEEYAYQSCLLYLKEECSVMCLWASELYDFEVYPTGRNKAMIATYQKIIQHNFPEHLKSVSLHFRKYKNFLKHENLKTYA